MSLEVIGVTAAKGQGGFGDDLDDNIITPYTTVQRRLTGRGNGQNINQVMISGMDGYPGPNIVADVSALMRERRNVGANEDDNFNVFDSQQLADVISSSTKVMTSLLGAVAGVSLLVGGIGIMNIMLVSVTERTREIGIRLAIGARAREVLLQFLVEAVTLSCVGGVAGIILAYGLCSASPRWWAPFLFDPKINIIAFVFSAAIGILFGFMPARRAARGESLDHPLRIEALQAAETPPPKRLRISSPEIPPRARNRTTISRKSRVSAAASAIRGCTRCAGIFSASSAIVSGARPPRNATTTRAAADSSNTSRR
jgi:putative ABC transport system permease protein